MLNSQNSEIGKNEALEIYYIVMQPKSKMTTEEPITADNRLDLKPETLTRKSWFV